MKQRQVYTFRMLLLLLLGFVLKTCAAASDAWSFELSNQSGDQATLNKVWCGSPTGDLAFGPVQGADTSAPDASIWAATQPIDKFLLQLHLPPLDYSCLLEVQGFSTPLWNFSLPLLTLDQDGWAAGDIKCDTPWHISGDRPTDIPPLCQLFGDDGYAIASIRVTSLKIDQSKTTAPAPSPSTNAPAPSSDSSSSTDGQRASTSSSGMSSAPSDQPPSPANMSPPTTAPVPGRKLLSLS